MESAGDAARTALRKQLRETALAHLEKHDTYEEVDKCEKMIKD